MKGLGVNWPAETVMKWEQFERRGMHDLKYVTPRCKMFAISQPLALAGLALVELLAGLELLLITLTV